MKQWRGEGFFLFAAKQLIGQSKVFSQESIHAHHSVPMETRAVSAYSASLMPQVLSFVQMA